MNYVNVVALQPALLQTKSILQFVAWLGLKTWFKGIWWDDCQHNTFWLSIKILNYFKEGIIAKSSSTTHHGNVICSNETLPLDVVVFNRKVLFKVFQNFNWKSESVTCEAWTVIITIPLITQWQPIEIMWLGAA